MKITMNPSRTAEEISGMCGGTLHLRATASLPSVSGICTDSREADADTMLCAIRGERVDGHRFLPAAIRAGCRVCLCERLPDGWDDLSSDGPMGDAPAAAIVVDDTVAALGRLAAARRESDLSTMKTVAVTGSVGKTTTKEMIAAVLAAGAPAGKSFKKDGNYNSVIGLPMSMMEIPADTTHAILEMGMSGRGEIAAMTAAARPDIALVINIGTSHMEQLGSRENIAAAKLEIAEGLRPGGILLLCGDEPLLESVTCPSGVDTVLRLTLSDAPGAAFAARRIRAERDGMTFDLHTPDSVLTDLFVPAPGGHMVWAGAYAAAVGILCGFSADTVRAGLAAYRPAALRQNRRTVGTMTFIEDCYNAAPESMRAALDVLDITAAHAPAPARRVAVLGSMMALGEQTADRHREVGRTVAAHAPDRLITVGALGAFIAEGARAAGLPADRILVLGTDIAPDAPAAPDHTVAYPALAETIASHLSDGDILLFKASRAMELEKLSAALEAHIQNH